jgi:teichuronic acid biosynthesis glycosyltransferase TuaC
MIFSKRQVKSLESSGVMQQTLYLENRNSISAFYKYYREAKKLIRQYDLQLVHSHYGTLTSMFCSLLGKPMIITFQGSDINYTPSDGMLRDFFGRLLSNITTLFASRIICVSLNVKSMVWWAKHKCEIIPIGVNPEIFYPRNQDECRKQLGWSSNEFIILFNANNPSIKRIDIAEKAVSIVRESGFRNVRLEVMSGFVEASLVPVMMNASDCILLCSDNEGSPTVIKEAMACNKAIVSNDVGDVVQRVQEVTQAYIVKKDPYVIAEKLIEMAAMDHIPESNGREILLRDGLTDQQTTLKVKKIYMDLVSEIKKS